MLLRSLRQPRNLARRGSVMIEFALASSFLVMMFIGVVTFGYDFYSYNRLESIIRNGARFASIQTYDSNTGLDPALACASCSVVLDPATSEFARRTADFTVYGTPDWDGTTQPLVEGLSASNVVVTLDVKNNMPTYVMVAITGYPMVTPGGRITLNGKPATSFPWMGRAASAP